MRLLSLLGLALLVLGNVLVVPTAADEPEVANEFCPVQPTQPTLPEYRLEFGGKTIHFCCEHCIHAFKKNPRAYLKNLPQFEEVPAELEGELESGDTLLGKVNQAETRQHLSLFLLASAGLLLACWVAKWLLGRLRWRMSIRPRLAEVGMCVLLGSIVTLYFRAEALGHKAYQSDLKDLLHFATYHDFGETPVPAKPPMPPRLQATFYRGNDERSPRLFNGGNYRTCMFHVSLVDAQGQELSYGAEASAASVKFEIERAPHTPDFFWTPDRMGRYFLTRRCDPFMGSEGPITDRVNLRTVEDSQRWEAVFPIPGLSSRGDTDSSKAPQVNLVALDADRSSACCCSANGKHEGIIYVCEEFATDTKMVGARMHYAIQYELHIGDGRIEGPSALWMGALYRTRKVLQWRLPLHEWFSHEPIPELPRPAASTDPNLLGISDYTKSPAAEGGGPPSHDMD